MPILGGLLSGLFVAIAEFFAKWITRKAAAAAAGITVFVGLSTAMYLALAAIVAGIVVTMPMSSAVATGIWMFVPDNAPAVVSACLVADTTVAVYRMNVMNVQFAVYAP